MDVFHKGSLSPLKKLFVILAVTGEKSMHTGHLFSSQ